MVVSQAVHSLPGSNYILGPAALSKAGQTHGGMLIPSAGTDLGTLSFSSSCLLNPTFKENHMELNLASQP